VQIDYHVSNAMLPEGWYTGFKEEVQAAPLMPHCEMTLLQVYNFDRDPRSTGNIVIESVDDTSYYGQPPNGNDLHVRALLLAIERPVTLCAQGHPHPITWYRDGGTDLGGPGYEGSTWVRAHTESLSPPLTTCRPAAASSIPASECAFRLALGR
jgi:hypothetical protein